MTIHYEKHLLPNGLRFLAAPMKETKAVTILILVGAGSRYEDKRINGVAHFLEHMFFKGTTKRPSTLEISRELDAMGADYNAFTGEEYTGYYVRVAADDFLQAFDIVTDMLLDPLFQAEEIEREKGVIIEELNMYEDTPTRAIHDQAGHLVYGDTPLGRNIGGSKETVTKFDRQDFIEFRKKFYGPDNLIVAIGGAGDPKQWKTQVEARFSHLAGTSTKTYEPAVVLQSGPRVHLGEKKTDQAHLHLSYPTFARTDERRPIMQMLHTILGGSMSSRLFIEVRERRGLAYYVRSGLWDFRDTGALTASAGVQVDKIDEAITVIREQLEGLRTDLVTEEELDRAKKNLRGSLYLHLEDSMSITDYIADYELFWDQVKQPEEVIERLNRVTREEIQALAREFILPEKANLAIIGPYDNEERFAKLLA